MDLKASHKNSSWFQIAVLITTGQSDDLVDGPATTVADGGISLFAVGESLDFHLVCASSESKLI